MPDLYLPRAKLVPVEWSWTTAIVLVAGFGSGVLAAILGVGGAIITTPVIRFLGATPIHAVGSTVPAILPGALTGTLRYAREGYVNWRVAATCGGSGVAFAAIGAWVAGQVDARWLMVVTAVLVLWSGGTLVRDAQRRPIPSAAPSAVPSAIPSAIASEAEAEPTVEPTAEPVERAVRDGVPILVALGVIAGFLAGLLGIGGGLVLTPGLVLGVRLQVKEAIATSLAAVAVMSVTALITHIRLGHIDWEFAAPLAIGIVPGARVGAHLTVGASEHTMRRLAGVLLIAVSILYLGRELADLA